MVLWSTVWTHPNSDLSFIKMLFSSSFLG